MVGGMLTPYRRARALTLLFFGPSREREGDLRRKAGALGTSRYRARAL